ncbi:MAG: OmpH family outer membrane protein [Cytophagales bacterium]|nr:OmpH family outer membrane protein [Cytophagales bacterium]
MKRFLSLCSLMLAATSLTLSVYFRATAPKIAYVRSAVVVENYLGTKEARAVYRQREAEWQANLDTLGSRLEETTGQYQASFAAWSPAEQARQRTELARKEQELEKYGAAIREKAQAEEDKLLGGALAQINSFVKAYARERGYTVVLGTTQSGSLLYASDAVDITDPVLRGLNESYKK